MKLNLKKAFERINEAGMEDVQSIHACAAKRLSDLRLSDIPDTWKICKGQEHAKRGLVVAGVMGLGTTVTLIGPRATGKSLLAAGASTFGVTCYEVWPCPCGYFESPKVPCRCSSHFIERHRQPIIKTYYYSPIHLECSEVPFRTMRDGFPPTSLADARRLIDQARSLKEPEQRVTPEIETILRHAMTELGLNNTIVELILRIASAVARLDGRDHVATTDVLEAVQYRRLDRWNY